MKQRSVIYSSLLALSLATLSLTACDKSDKKAEAPATAITSTTQTTTKTETAPIPASALTATATPSAVTNNASSTPAPTTPLTVLGNTAAAAATIDQIMSIMGSGMLMANKMTQQTEGKPKFSTEQIDCMASKGNDIAVTDMQGFLQQNFSEAEMKQMNDYFASNAGKKQSEMTKNMMAAVVKDNKDLPKVEMTPQEKKEMDAFWKSATGTKLGTLLKNKEKLRPVMTKIVDKKQVDCNLPKAENSTKPSTETGNDNKAK